MGDLYLVAIAVVAALTVLMTMAMLLRHLEKLHLTKSQDSQIRQWAMDRFVDHRIRFEALATEVANEKAKLTQLSNRTR